MVKSVSTKNKIGLEHVSSASAYYTIAPRRLPNCTGKVREKRLVESGVEVFYLRICGAQSVFDYARAVMRQALPDLRRYPRAKR